MRENDVRKLFEPFALDEEKKEELWTQISNRGEQTEAEDGSLIVSKQRRLRGWHRAVAAAAIVLLLWGAGAAVNAATGGNLAKQIREWFRQAADPQTEQDIVEEAVTIGSKTGEVYAPDIMARNERYLVFGNLRGILVYDLQKDRLLGSIDTQKIGCAYFGTYRTHTRLLLKNKDIYVFNESQGSLKGKLHQFRIREEEISDGQSEEKIVTIGTMTVKNEAADLFRQWKKQEKTRDTFDTFAEDKAYTDTMGYLWRGDHARYSRNSYPWKSADGKKTLNFLTIQDGIYRLYECNRKDKKLAVYRLCLTVEERKRRPLPEFRYTGNDRALAAIISYQQEQYKEKEGQGCWIPGFIIFKRVWEGDQYLVFGYFGGIGYRKIGNILQCVDGSNDPACFHLKKTADGYQVQKVDYTGDGAFYGKGIRKFTRNYPGLYKKYFHFDNNKKKKNHLRYLQMYVKNNDLDVKYYMISEDPVKIFK